MRRSLHEIVVVIVNIVAVFAQKSVVIFDFQFYFSLALVLFRLFSFLDFLLLNQQIIDQRFNFLQMHWGYCKQD